MECSGTGAGMARAIIFDMDDTLYRERRFVLSGFSAVARRLCATRGLDAHDVFGSLANAMRTGRRRVALQLLCERFELPTALVGELVNVIRSHRPRLKLPRTTRDVLTALRPAWRLGILTNGLPAIQARKVEALGLRPLVDEVIFATEHGQGTGKPDQVPFQTITARLDVSPDCCVFVGDDPRCDIDGAKRAGMWSVRLDRPGRGQADDHGSGRPDSIIRCLSQLPDQAATLVEGRPAHDIHDRSSHHRR